MKINNKVFLKDMAPVYGMFYAHKQPKNSAQTWVLGCFVFMPHCILDTKLSANLPQASVYLHITNSDMTD
jgi:hypothetical protein